MTINIKFLDPRMTLDHLGLLPHMLFENDPRPAKEQFNERYAHGGGWGNFPGFKMLPGGDLQYPEDEPTRRLAEWQFRDETIAFFDSAWVAVIQKNGSFEVSRMD